MNLPPINQMLEVFFAWTWKTSLQASVLAALVWMIQFALGKWLRPRWRYALGLLVLLRLVLPAVPASNFSVFNLGRELATPSEIVIAPDPLPKQNAARPMLSDIDSIVLPGETKGSRAMPGWGGAFKGVWLFGFAGLLAVSMWRHRKLSRWAEAQPPVADARVMGLLQSCKASLNVTCEIKVVTTTLLTTPAVFRFRKPFLLLPIGMLGRLDDRELKMIFLHELVHILHGDILLNWAAIIVRSLHWFNPLVWAAVRRLRADQELVCDARVVCLLAADERRLYGNTLIKLLDDFSEAGLCPILVPVINSKQEIKRRITMIAKFRPTTRAALLCFMAFLVALGCFTFTRAADKSDATPKSEPAKKPLSREEALQQDRQQTADNIENLLQQELKVFDKKVETLNKDLSTLQDELRIPPEIIDGETGWLGDPVSLHKLEEARLEARSTEIRIKAMFSQLNGLPREQLAKVLPTVSPDVVLAELLSHKAQAEQQLASLSSKLTRENLEVKQVDALLTKIDEQIKDRVEGIMAGFRIQAESAKTHGAQLEKELNTIRANDLEKNNRF
ncbi:MAG: M56 family metallopeptidase, partial [Verrucomicrobiota bacterium]